MEAGTADRTKLAEKKKDGPSNIVNIALIACYLAPTSLRNVNGRFLLLIVMFLFT
jgi:hypothetical protein